MTPQAAVLPPKPPRQITGRMVLIGFILFFGVISVVNGIFMYMALHTWPGLTTEQAYKEGIKYNETLADGERQAALGWHSRVTISEGVLSINVTSKQGAAVSGLEMTAVVMRPLGSEQQIVVRPLETGAGQYQAQLSLPSTGRWKVDLTAKTGDGETYRMRYEVLVVE